MPGPSHPPPPGPERDRWLASQPRSLPRRKRQLGEEVRAWMRSPEARRIQRTRRIHTALAEVLTPAELEKVRPVSVVKGSLTLAVADNLLLAELRNLRHGALVAALVNAGTGIGRIRYRLARR